MSQEKIEVELELDPEVVEFLEQDGIDGDAIVRGLLELQRAKDQYQEVQQ